LAFEIVAGVGHLLIEEPELCADGLGVEDRLVTAAGDLEELVHHPSPVGRAFPRIHHPAPLAC
jgi:hypothetical protein